MEKMGADEHQTARTEQKAGNQRRVVFLKIKKRSPPVSLHVGKRVFSQLRSGLHRERCFPTRRQFPAGIAGSWADQQLQRPLQAPTWILPGFVGSAPTQPAAEPNPGLLQP